MTNVIRIALWSAPRNISTAMMYAFAQRPDTTVVDEPLFGYFLQQTGVDRPSRDEVLQTMELDGEAIIRQTILGPCESRVLFLKNIANHLIDLDWSFLEKLHNIILTRDPGKMLLSYNKVVEQPTMLDTAYAFQTQLLDHILDRGQQPIVVETNQVLSDPEGILKQICKRLDIPFNSSMLQWPAGPRPEDGVWAKYWYHNLHRSTSFGPPNTGHAELPEHLEALYRECLPHYRKLLQYQLKTWIT